VFSCSKIEQKQLNTWVSFQSAEQPLLGQFSVSGNSGRAKIISRAMMLRHYHVVADLLRKYPTGQDKTMYCIGLGYAGRRKVIVSDGKVVSHGHQDWNQFSQRIRTKAKAATAA